MLFLGPCGVIGKREVALCAFESDLFPRLDNTIAEGNTVKLGGIQGRYSITVDLHCEIPKVSFNPTLLLSRMLGEHQTAPGVAYLAQAETSIRHPLSPGSTSTPYTPRNWCAAS